MKVASTFRALMQITPAFVLMISITVLSQMAHAAALNKEQDKQIKTLAETVQQSDLSYQLLESLTTEVGHRRMGTAGDKRAIAWAVGKMKELGFDKVWTEKVSAPQWLRGDIEAKVLAPYEHDLAAIGLGGTVGTSKKGITAPLVHFNTLEALQAAPTGSLTNKIAFVSYRMQAKIDGSDYGKAVAARSQGAVVAAEKGAIGFIMRSVGTDNNRTPHTGMMRYKDGVKKIPAAAISNPDADLLVNMFKRGKPVQFHLRISAEHRPNNMIESASVIGEIVGTEQPDNIIALGAHLDSWDVGTGAMDDGLGIAITMAAAKHIADLPQRPKRTIRVILYAGEEVGFYGTKQYMKNHQQDIEKHIIGAEWDFGLGKIYELSTGNVGAKSLPYIDDLAQYLAPFGVAYQRDNSAHAQSDMVLLSEAGMPAVNFAPDGYRYFDYHHTANDTLDKINPDDLKQNTTVYTVFAYFASHTLIDFRQ
jgi:Zn-dependent M28 family amino/carboxypeptidase